MPVQENDVLRQQVLSCAAITRAASSSTIVPDGVEEPASTNAATLSGRNAGSGRGPSGPSQPDDDLVEGALVAQLTAALADKARLVVENDRLHREVAALQVGLGSPHCASSRAKAECGPCSRLLDIPRLCNARGCAPLEGWYRK